MGRQMANYDARDSKSLRDAWAVLGETQSLSEFLASVEELDIKDRERIVDQALVWSMNCSLTCR